MIRHADVNLTRREREVLTALLAGSTDKEIASKLSITLYSARDYVKAVRAKFRAKSRTALVVSVYKERMATLRAERR